LKLAEIYRIQKRPELRERALREAVAAEPNRSTWEPLGQFLLETMKLEEAEQVFVQMLLASSADPPAASRALSSLGDVHGAQGQWENASSDYKQAIGRTTDKDVVRSLQKKLNRAQE